MTNPYYNVTGAPPAQNRGASASIRNEFTLIQTGFDALVSNFAAKGNVSGQTWTGTHNFPSTTYGVTATAGSNNTLLSTTEYVDRAISVLPAGTLPSVTGKDTTWNLTPNATGTGVQWTQGAGSGGTAITGNVTLTSASPAAMTVTPTTYGLYATLPVGTTLPKAACVFSFYNAGDYDYGLKDSAGTQLGWIRPKTGAVIGVSDNSTAAGSWVLYGVEKLGITANYSNSTLTNMGSSIVRVAIDANRTFFAFGNTDCYGIIYDASTQTWGSATLIRSGISAGQFTAILSATNQVLVITSTGVTTIQAVTLTIASTAITVNTPINSAATSSFVTVPNQIIAVGSSFVLSFQHSAAASAIIALTVSGTVPTFGTEAIPSGGATGSIISLYVSGSIVRAIAASSTVLTCTPYTVSGVSLSVGTAATATTTAAAFRSFQNVNGNIVAEYLNSSHFATIFKLTGTVEAASSVSLGTAPSGITNSAYIAIGNKAVFLSAPAGNTWYANILTDTGGTASAGTQISGTVSGTTLSSIAGLFVSGNTAKFAWQCSSGSSSAGTLTFDCSGSSPTLSDIKTLNGGSGGQVSYSVFLGQPLDQTRHQATLVSGTNAISIGNGVSTVYGLQVSANSISKVLLTPMRTTNGIVGATNNESYFVTQVDGSSTGIAIMKLEMAA